MKNILIIGATSTIAEKIAQNFAETEKCRFHLLARNEEKLRALKADLQTRGAQVSYAVFDAENIEETAVTLDRGILRLENISHCLVAHGILPNNDLCAVDAAVSRQNFYTNGLSAIECCRIVANQLARQKGGGVLTAISSVAANRGRKKNYAYGAAKAALSVYLQGLMHRFAAIPVIIQDVRPGPIDTPMTAHEEKSAIFSDATVIAEQITKCMKNKGSGTYYCPPFFFLIMTVIAHLPFRIFKRLSI